MRKRSVQTLAEEDLHINLTPLIDVVFVVLIMFIIIAPMLEIDKVELAPVAKRDDKQPAVVQENSPVTIHVHADNSIWIQGRALTPQELLPCLVQAKRNYPNKVPQLFHDKKACFGTYQTVKNALEEAGFEHLDIVLQP